MVVSCYVGDIQKVVFYGFFLFFFKLVPTKLSVVLLTFYGALCVFLWLPAASHRQEVQSDTSGDVLFIPDSTVFISRRKTPNPP